MRGYDENQTFYFQISFRNVGDIDNAPVTVTREHILDEIVVTAFGYTSDYYQDYKSLSKDLRCHMDKGNYKKALVILDARSRKYAGVQGR